MNKSFRTITDLATIPVPEATPTYQPVPQAELWDRVIDNVKQFGYDIVRETHQVHRKKSWFISKVSLRNPSSLRSSDEIEWEIAAINSYDCSKAVCLLFGGSVFACTNGLIVAQHVLRTKHTTGVWNRLPAMLTMTINRFEVEINKAAYFYDRLKEIPFTRSNLSEFSVRLAQQGLLPKAKVVDLVEESMTPSFGYDTRERQVLWNVHNAYTHLAKDMNPVEAPRKIMGMERMMRDHYALV